MIVVEHVGGHTPVKVRGGKTATSASFARISILKLVVSEGTLPNSRRSRWFTVPCVISVPVSVFSVNVMGPPGVAGVVPLNSAVTVVVVGAPVGKVMVHVFGAVDPLHAPPQLPGGNVCPVSAVAVSVTLWPTLKSQQYVPQLVPCGLTVTVPAPVFVTVSRCLPDDGGVVGGVVADVTVTCIVAAFWSDDESLTVMVAVPAKTPLTVNVVPEIVAVAMFVAEDAAVCVPVPPEI